MIDCSIVIPYRPDTPQREAIYRWCRRYWQARGYTVVTGRCLAGPWIKAKAVAAAMARVKTPWVAVADADILISDLEWACHGLEREGRRWAVPHWMVYRLRSDATALLLEVPPETEYPMAGIGLHFADLPYPGHIGGGLVVLQTDDYYQVPLDPRFEGWGHEDDAWGMALQVLLGPPWRGDAPLYHLWHPPQARPSRAYGSEASQALYAQYRQARRDREQFRALVPVLNRRSKPGDVAPDAG